jgi:hypothetical protein
MGRGKGGDYDAMMRRMAMACGWCGERAGPGSDNIHRKQLSGLGARRPRRSSGQALVIDRGFRINISHHDDEARSLICSTYPMNDKQPQFSRVS